MIKQTNDSIVESLNTRSQEIFRHIVDSYFLDGEPIGSRNLSRMLSSSLSPATIRNVMSDLEKLGLIYAPHASAGRLPTQRGLRFFIDAFMELGDLTEQERQNIENQLISSCPSGAKNSLEKTLVEVSQVLSGMSHGAGLVWAAKREIALKHIEFVQLEPQRALVILVSQNGDVENRLIDLPIGITSSQLAEAANFLNSHVRGCTIAEAKNEIEKLKIDTGNALNKLSQQLVERGLAVWAGSDENFSEWLIVRGRSNLLESLENTESIERLKCLFDDLETQKDILQLLDLTEGGSGVRIFIGSENKLFSLSGSSLVVSPYSNKNARVIGALGIIGPTRLNYARIVPMVDYTAQLISKMID